MVDLRLRRKPYLQPFESVLAGRELSGLLSNSNIGAGPVIEMPNLDDSTANTLIRRLAYFDEYDLDGEKGFTQQTLREVSQTHDPLNAGKLPKSRRLRFGAHDIHEYRGKFFPQLVRALINQANLSEGATICDPMSGSGTTALEVVDLGLNFIGTDLNPLSIVLTSAKAQLANGLDAPQAFEARRFLKGLPGQIRKVKPESAFDEGTLRYLDLWFTRDVLHALISIRNCISQMEGQEKLQQLFRVVLSSIIRSVSHQVEDDLRVRKGVSTYAPKEVLELFLTEARRQVDLLERLGQVYRVYDDRSGRSTVSIRAGDARGLEVEFPEYLGKVDCLITSPPYATALPYLDTDRLSLMTLGLIEKSHLKDLELKMIGTREISERQRRDWWDNYLNKRHILTSEINDLIEKIADTNHGEGVGFRRRNLPALLGKYFLDMRENLESALRILKPGSFAFYVVGSNSTKLGGNKLVIETDNLLYELAKLVGFEQVDFLNMDLLASRDMFRENRGSSESLLTLRKPIND